MNITPKQIARKVKGLRLERHWTQVRLARLLGLSQNRLSEIENGQGSFTAEQLIAILTAFNVPLEYFVPGGEPHEAHLQKLLARFGARHLAEDPRILPSERIRSVIDLVREVIVSAKSPRLITGLAPVIVNHSDPAILNKLRLELHELGFIHRYGWILQSIADAVTKEWTGGKLPDDIRLKYLKCVNIIGDSAQSIHASVASKTKKGADILGIDDDISSPKTLSDVQKHSSHTAKRWGIVTRIQDEDFVSALKDGFNY